MDVTFSLLLMSGDHLPDPAGGGQHVSIPRPQFSRAQPHHPSEHLSQSHVTVIIVFVCGCQPLAAALLGLAMQWAV